MTYEPFPIVDFKTGLFTAKEAWMSPADAFEDMDNAYVFRGKITKRKGHKVFGWFPTREGNIGGITQANPAEVTVTGHSLATGDRIIIQSVVGMTEVNNRFFYITKTGANTFTLDGEDSSGYTAYSSAGTVDQILSLAKAGTISAITKADPPVITTSAAHGLTTGDTVAILDISAGMTEINDCISTATVLTTTTFQLDNVNAVEFTAYTSGGTVGTLTTDQAGARITGLGELRRNAADEEILVVSDTRLAKYDTSLSNLTAISTSDDFTGGATDYFQISSYVTNAYLTNFVDRPYQYDGSTLSAMTIDIDGDTSNEVTKVRWMSPYKRRMVLLNTVEDGTAFKQRARWSAIVTDPTAALSWDDTVGNGGGFVDAPTSDEIVTAVFLKDTLIVFFNRSVWALKATGSADLPFRWEKIDDLTATFDAPFSAVGHQNQVWCFGNAGWFLSDAFQTKQFDTPIPNFEDQFTDSNRNLLSSARNLNERQIWMSYPCCQETANSRILVYNFETPSFSEFDLAFNVASEVTKEFAGDTWDDIDDTWDSIDDPWDSFAAPAGSPEFLFGLNDGVLRRANQGSSDTCTKINFEALSSRWQPFKGQQAQLGWIDFLVSVNEGTTMNVEIFSDWDPSARVSTQIDFGSEPNERLGNITNITQADPAVVTLKCHGLATGDKVLIKDVVGMTEVNNRSFTVTKVSDSTFSLDGEDSSGYTAYSSGGVAFKKAGVSGQDKQWKRVYCDVMAPSHRVKLSHLQSGQPVQIHAIVPYFRQAGRVTP